MFLLNRGYTTKIDSSLSLEGMVVSASGLHMPTIERRSLTDTSIRLFDPQLYFPIDLHDDCSATYNKLATYPWYNQTAPQFDSAEINLRDYARSMQEEDLHNNISLPIDDAELESRIKSCLDFQCSLDVSHLILPTTLVDDAEDQFTYQLEWINKGLELCEDYNKPVLITLALSDNVIITKNFEDNELLQTILDNMTTFNNVEGFYIIISRSNSGTHVTEKHIVQTILELSYILGTKMGKKVFLNFIDNLGLLGLSVGASYFASGYTNKEKRFNLSDFEDSTSGGAPLPHFFSFSLLGDLFSKRDLEKLRDSHLLHLISNDVTSYSQNLFDALSTNINVNLIPDWAETRNNITKAKLHRIELMNQRATYISSLSFKERITYTLSWLQNADINTNYICERFRLDPLSEDFRHLTVWRECFESFIEKYSLL